MLYIPLVKRFNMKSETLVFSPRKRMKEALGTIAYVAPEAVFFFSGSSHRAKIQFREASKGFIKGIFM